MTTPPRDLIAWSLAALALAPGLPASTSITPGAPATQGVLDAADIEPIPASDDRSGAAFFREGFTFSVGRPGMVQIDLQSAFDAYLILYGPGDVEVARNDDFQNTSQSRISTMLTQTGTHRVIVTSFSAGQGGQFTLAVSEIQSDAEPSRDQTIRLGQTIQGTLEMGDAAVLPEQRGTPDYFRDGFVFRARSGQSVTIDLACNFDGYLYLVDTRGTVLVSNDDFGSVNTSRIIATLGSGGPHRIVVTSFSPGTGGTYSLSLMESSEVDPNQLSPMQAEQMMAMQIQQGGWTPQAATYTPPGMTAPAGASPGGRTARAGLEIVSDPLNVSADAGEVFTTALRVHNSRGAGFNELRLLVRYDPELLRPLRVSDHKLRPLTRAAPSLTSSLPEGWIRYEAQLASVEKSDGFELITIEWRALAPVRRTLIEVVAGPDGGTMLRLDGGHDLLGTPEDAHDGTVNTDVAIEAGGLDHLLTGPLTGRPSEPTGLALRLSAPSHSVRVGESVDLDVVLLNPKPEAFDEVVFTLRFDPRLFEPVDLAEGGYPPRSDNWITRGINLLDEPFHGAFPFDRHLRNEVFAGEGRAEYHMGLSRARPLAGGVIARLRLRALAPSEAAAIHFAPDDGGAVASVRAEGVDLLGGETEGITLVIR